MFTAAAFFFWEIPKCVQACPTWIIIGMEVACLPSWLEMVIVGWLRSMQSEIFLQMKFIIFQGFPTKQAAFLLRHSTPYNQVLVQPLWIMRLPWKVWNLFSTW